MNAVYRRTVLVFGLLAIVLGFAILVRTAYEGGGGGYVFGGLFVALGGARLYLLLRR